MKRLPAKALNVLPTLPTRRELASTNAALWKLICNPLLPLSILSLCSHAAAQSADSSRSSAPIYTLGTAIKFGTSGNSGPYQVSGWSSAEPGHIWTDKTTAVLAIKLPQTTGPIDLHVRMSGLTKNPEVPFQPVTVTVNGSKVADWQVGAETDYVATIPPDVVNKAQPLKIELGIPKATSPKKLGVGEDDRNLGLNVSEIRLDASHS